jgi:hypothetical protein
MKTKDIDFLRVLGVPPGKEVLCFSHLRRKGANYGISHI